MKSSIKRIWDGLFVDKSIVKPNYTTIWEMSCIAANSYEEGKKECTFQGVEWSVARTYENELTDTELIVYEFEHADEKKNKIICFRGTDSVKDFFFDILTRTDYWPDSGAQTAKVHRGFGEKYRAIQGFCQEEILKDPESELYFVGHSSGGALATLASLEAYNLGKPGHLVTFGCPRVGNEAFTAAVEARCTSTIQVVNGNDIITKLPLGFMVGIGGYSYIPGYTFHLNSQEGLFSPFRDHLIGSYQRSIQKLMKK